MPILTAEKVDKRPPPPHPLPPPTPQKMNRRLPRRPSFLQSIIFTETLLCYIFAFCYYYFFELAENGENLISAHPRISAHSQGPKI